MKNTQELMKQLNKNDKIIFTYNGNDNYKGILLKNLKCKLVVEIYELNDKPYEETRDFDKNYINSIGEFINYNCIIKIEI